MQSKKQKKKRQNIFQRAINKAREVLSEGLQNLSNLIKPTTQPNPPISTNTPPNPEVSQLTPTNTTTDNTQDVSQLTPTDTQTETSHSFHAFQPSHEVEYYEEPPHYEENLRIKSLRKRGQEVINLANQRWEAIEERDLESMAITRAIEESGGVREFSLDDLESEWELMNEITRARKFLEDYTSTINGAEVFTNELRYMNYRSKFGNQWRNQTPEHETYDTRTIEPNSAKIAFKVYRMVEETRAVSIAQLGSDTVMALMYDYVLNSGYTDDDSSTLETITNDIVQQIDSMVGHEYLRSRVDFEKENAILDYFNIDSSF